ncbi:MAG: hypothetical protein A2900_02020 [Candidatus Chisholmbacteria bacterium RIFCSPLOWO2_01_FULL_50_28]|uniref:Peptidase S11 D-alanyl-D-alanine carboxypeptidase A N-terminal domain-containing protein n=1 Tax=Candidatus Chisholmbacteria bacterium RIFCSPHIGHO2_01_FULL_52_32 TaxID=1797591 RepID=A0A1G1VTT3_9BACT|nr:MAG: hypothetical protein A2786_04725 [Candidatus Chisholmbacteria bacterium RIFCSPHIGHO2_01_FULL_52_32]OGY19860.1 MAG: hypothetical protein A2900_02020 [Candidatus Chisholmbacteria bacterium RIFCSPLOWO2_01_FULL_50_28]
MARHGRKKRTTLRESLLLFTKKAFSLRKRPAFIALGLILLFLPGNGYYQDLSLIPDQSSLRPIPFELPPVSPYPVPIEGIAKPAISARAGAVVDVGSAVVLYTKNPTQQLFPASTTKIMTALVVLKAYPLDQVITVKQADRAIGQTMNLVPGERMTVENLLYGLLLESGNDAAFALAENYPGGYYAFVDQMNALAREIHLENTRFRNVSGVEQNGHYTTVLDLARLASVAMKDTTFAKIVGTKTAVVTDVDAQRVHPLENKNELLGEVEGIRGVKTGWTELAGECLVTDTIRDGKEIIAVVLGSANRFGDSERLIEWAYSAHTWKTLDELLSEGEGQ